jgi:hypothetical protein
MKFTELPRNSKKLLDEIVEAENPTQLLCDRFENSSTKEDEELRSLIKELCQLEYIRIPMWAGNKPYHVVVNNSARTYDEQLARYEEEKRMQRETVCIGTINDQSVKIGNGNKISNLNIAGRIENHSDSVPSDVKKSFYKKHPIICSFLISLLAGIVVLFSFWSKVVKFIEGVL